MTDMTVTEHNEKLVVEKAILQRRITDQRHEFGLIIGAIMRQMKRKSVKIKPENLVLPGVHLHTHEDGSIEIKFQEQVEPNGEA